MYVRNAVAMNDHADALWIEDGAHSAAGSLCHDHDVCGDAAIDIREMVDVPARDNGAFSAAKGRRVMNARQSSSE